MGDDVTKLTERIVKMCIDCKFLTDPIEIINFRGQVMKILKEAAEIKDGPSGDGDTLIADKGQSFDWHDRKGGPSEEERKWLQETIQGCEEAVKLRQETNIPVGSGENIQTFKRFLETALKLKKAWG